MPEASISVDVSEWMCDPGVQTEHTSTDVVDGGTFIVSALDKETIELVIGIDVMEVFVDIVDVQRCSESIKW